MNLADVFPDGDYRFHMGLQRGKPEDFFGNTDAHVAIIDQRRSWLRAAPDRYSASLPECGPLLEEAIALARGWIHPEGHARLKRAESIRERCLTLGELLEPDLLLLGPDANDQFQLVGGCVCFPSSWSLAEKIGRPLNVIHDPVPGLNSGIGKQIDAFLSRIAPGTAWLRHNWGLSASPELNQHPHRALPRLGSTVEPGEVWLRVEHQALVALPESKGILFGIRIAVHPLAEVKQDALAARRLIRALRTMPDEVAAYKNIAPARSAILGLLES
jgi:hypothetical protein